MILRQHNDTMLADGIMQLARRCNAEAAANQLSAGKAKNVGRFARASSEGLVEIVMGAEELPQSVELLTAVRTRKCAHFELRGVEGWDVLHCDCACSRNSSSRNTRENTKQADNIKRKHSEKKFPNLSGPSDRGEKEGETAVSGGGRVASSSSSIAMGIGTKPDTDG